VNAPTRLLAGIALLSLTGCPDRTIGNKIDDALDNRPAEKVQDLKDDVKDATN
jgi:hypothetical protein